MRVGFFLREAVRSMSRNAVPSFAAMASVLVTVLVLGMFIPVVQATTGAANDVRGRVLVNVYLKTNAKPGDVQRVKRLLATRVVKLTTGLLTVLLVIASVLLVSNTIRLSLFSRRREVEVMKLVGATDWFIRWPFVIEGIVLGALGGLMAILLLLVGKIALLDPLISQFALLAAPKTIHLGLLVVVLLLASIAVSAAGSGLSLRRFLRV